MKKNIDIQDVIFKIREGLGLVPKELIGVDIGQSSVKISKIVTKNDTYKLVKYASVPLPEAAIIEDEIQDEEALKEALEDAFKEAKVTEPYICLGLSGPNTVIKKLQLAGGDDEELEDQVIWEAEQYLPFPVEDCNIDWYVIGENMGGGLDVIVCAVKKDVLESFKSIIESLGKIVKVVDLCSIALTNIYELASEDDDIESNINNDFDDEVFESTSSTDVNKVLIPSSLLIDIGSQATVFIVLKKGIPVFVKEIIIGGASITEEIQRQLGVTFREAEDLKKMSAGGGVPDDVLMIINEINGTLVNELKKAHDFYINATSDDSLKNITVTGGSVRLPNLLEEIRSSFGVDVSVLNPFNEIEFNESDFDDDELNAMAHEGVVSFGLALREFPK
ncbi:type IV pilus assembly protein PilM [Bacteriovorax sp. BAL6_X]|uniref:type IV pilus assembly protein PilM n=1 Tax=Bacteriovorax sp. BAL6_X TaxID=1201290 RepID=UPI000385E8FB|nr:type IV pilus assembly protein PilM [Bacteriovorax sp. BAL6_X]EPZ50257.1 type IV pilus assembly protein PilM [Bacteriovorax sp. BAL6_X]